MQEKLPIVPIFAENSSEIVGAISKYEIFHFLKTIPVTTPRKIILDIKIDQFLSLLTHPLFHGSRPVICGVSDNLLSVLSQMASKNVRALFLADSEGKYQGVLSVIDILCFIYNTHSWLIRIKSFCNWLATISGQNSGQSPERSEYCKEKGEWYLAMESAKKRFSNKISFALYREAIVLWSTKVLLGAGGKAV